MIFRNLDSDSDWKFGHGKSDFVAQNDAVGLDIKTRLNSWVGDCFFDQGAGIDWINRLGSTGQRELLELDLKRVIQQTEGVTGILSFDTFLNGRAFSAEYSVETIYSKTYEDKIDLEL